MFEFRWSLPGPTLPHELRLQIHARSGWIGRKGLLLDGRALYRRRWFGGIDHTFAHPDDPGKTVVLRAVEQPDARAWAPELRCDGRVVPETTGAAPPPVPDRPKLVSIVVGATYLTIFMMVVMLWHIPKMLNAVRGHSDIRSLVLEVPGQGVDSGDLGRQPMPLGRARSAQEQRPGYPRIETETLPIAYEGEAYAAQLRVAGGQPPYQWVVNTRKLPEGLEFTENAETDDSRGATARLLGTPAARTAGTYAIEFRVTDAAYSPAKDIWPWAAPFAATTISLLGFWSMRRWSVPAYAGLILLQVLLGLGVAGYPLSITAIILQTLVWGVGAVHWARMH